MTWDSFEASLSYSFLCFLKIVTNVAKVATRMSCSSLLVSKSASLLGYSLCIVGFLGGVHLSFQKSASISSIICLQRLAQGVSTKVHSGEGIPADNTAITPVLPVPVGIRTSPVRAFAVARRY